MHIRNVPVLLLDYRGPESPGRGMGLTKAICRLALFCCIRIIPLNSEGAISISLITTVAFVVLQSWTFLFEVSLSSTLKTSRFLTRSGALLVVIVVDISRTPTVTSDVTILVAFIALWSTRTVCGGNCTFKLRGLDPIALPFRHGTDSCPSVSGPFTMASALSLGLMIRSDLALENVVVVLDHISTLLPSSSTTQIKLLHFVSWDNTCQSSSSSESTHSHWNKEHLELYSQNMGYSTC
ncbi:hypothetical protein Tco_1553486 [Tanacetum coccineum]